MANAQELTRRSILTETEAQDLSEPIADLREMLAKVAALAAEVEDVKNLAGLLDKYSQASTRLATLLKTQRALAGQNDLAEALHQALAEVLEEETPAGP